VHFFLVLIVQFAVTVDPASILFDNPDRNDAL
jgi:hypothetical protein